MPRTTVTASPGFVSALLDDDGVTPLLDDDGVTPLTEYDDAHHILTVTAASGTATSVTLEAT